MPFTSFFGDLVTSVRGSLGAAHPPTKRLTATATSQPKSMVFSLHGGKLKLLDGRIAPRDEQLAFLIVDHG